MLVEEGDGKPLAFAQVVCRGCAKAAGTNDDNICLVDHDAACSGIDANDRTLSRGWSVGLFLSKERKPERVDNTVALLICDIRICVTARASSGRSRGRYRGVTGPRCKIRKQPPARRSVKSKAVAALLITWGAKRYEIIVGPGVAQDRRPSLISRLKRMAASRIIAPRRSNSAHLHRPWRATHSPSVCGAPCSSARRAGGSAASRNGGGALPRGPHPPAPAGPRPAPTSPDRA